MLHQATSFALQTTYPPFYSHGPTAITPDGQLLVSAVNHRAHVTRVQSGEPVTVIQLDSEPLTNITVSPDASHLILASRSKSLAIYSLDTARETPVVKQLRLIASQHEAPITILATDPTSTLVASGSSDSTIRVWDIAKGFCTHVFRHGGGVVSALCWNMPAAGSSKGARTIQLFSGAVDGSVKLWDLQSAASNGTASKGKGKASSSKAHRAIATLSAHVSPVRGLAVSPDGRVLITGSRDRTLGHWVRGKDAQPDAKDDGWKLAETVTAGESVESVGLIPGPDALRFWTGGSGGEVRIWGVRGSTPQTRGLHLVQKEPQSSAFLPSRAAVSDADEEPVEDTHAIVDVHLVPTAAPLLLSVHADQILSMRSVPDLTLVRQLVGYNDDIVDATLLHPGPAPAGQDAQSATETHLAIATNSNFPRVYNLQDGEHHVELLRGDGREGMAHTGMVLCLDRSHDSRWLGSGSKDRTARIWAQTHHAAGDHSRPSWTCIAHAEGHAESVGAIAFARRAARAGGGPPFFVTASQDRTVKLWDLDGVSAQPSTDATPAKLRSLVTLRIHDKDINALDLSPNNALLVSGSQDKTAKVFALEYTPSAAGVSAATLRPLATCTGHRRGIWSVRVSPVDAAFATGSADRTVRLWSLKDYSCLKVFEGHAAGVLRVDFCNRATQLLSAGAEGLVRLWNVRDESCKLIVDAAKDRIWGLKVDRSERRFVTAGADSVVRIWRDDSDEKKKREQKEKEEVVQREQDFSNFLQASDYESAISLALNMNQPRRLLQLFTKVHDARPMAATNGAGKSTGKGKAAAAAALNEEGVPDLLALALGHGVASPAPAQTDATSLTGSLAVDDIIARLPALSLVQLLSFVRDWNTSARTCEVAQGVLHAVLRQRRAADLIDAFEEARKEVGRERERVRSAGKVGRDKDSDEESEEEDDDDAAARGGGKKDAGARKQKTRRAGPAPSTDLGALLDALIPYTERHLQRAERRITETAVLEYTLRCMDEVLGPDDGEDEMSEEGEDDGDERDGSDEDGEDQRMAALSESESDESEADSDEEMS